MPLLRLTIRSLLESSEGAIISAPVGYGFVTLKLVMTARLS